jgi:hypothetical protein
MYANACVWLDHHLKNGPSATALPPAGAAVSKNLSSLRLLRGRRGLIYHVTVQRNAARFFTFIGFLQMTATKSEKRSEPH